jgi:SAM-dependent methyltransferase
MLLGDIWNLWCIAKMGGLRRLGALSGELRRYGGAYSVISALMAFEECGLFDDLLSEDGLVIKQRPEFDHDLSVAICEYLCQRGILVATGQNVYKPSNRSALEQLRQVVYACLAYRDPVQHLSALLRREMRYGPDVSRNEGYDALASAALTSTYSFAFAASILARLEFHSLLDLGCGTGAFLNYLAGRDLQAQLFGLDHSATAIQHGKLQCANYPQIRLFAGDLFTLECIPINLSSLDMVSLMFVLHEFRDEQVHEILRSVRSRCPNARILLTELTASRGAALRLTAMPELEFVHKLSHQILRTADEWKALFKECGFSAKLAFENRLAHQLCICFGPDS